MFFFSNIFQYFRYQQNELAPKAKLLYSKARHLERLAAKFKAKNLLYKKNLQFLSKSPEFLTNLGNVNEIT